MQLQEATHDLHVHHELPRINYLRIWYIDDITCIHVNNMPYQQRVTVIAT